jgi:RHS repeat-associated protein
LLKRVDPDGTSTTYIGGIFEKKTDGTGTTITKYYGALGRNVAKRVRAPGQASNVAVSYVLADHLGSTVGMLDDNGALVSGSKTSYWPFGAVRSGGSALGDKLYTGQQKESDDGLGLYDYGARFYSTVLGRFAAVDPIVGSASDPQSWNGYSYVRNNPMSYVDPMGMDPAYDWVHSGSIGRERDTGCGPTCEALIALDSVGLHSADQVAAYQHEQLVAALMFLSAEASLTEQWTTSNSIANGGGSDCDTACQWMAASRAFDGTGQDVDWNAWVRWVTVAASRPAGENQDDVGALGLGALALASGSDYLKPGPNAGEGVPTLGNRRPTAEQQRAINAEGEAFGCHLCGASEPGTKSGNWVGDHMEPYAVGEPTTYYPSCLTCSRIQGGHAAAYSRTGDPNGPISPAVNSAGFAYGGGEGGIPGAGALPGNVVPADLNLLDDDFE